MTVSTTTTIALDPVREAEVIRQYENDTDYKKVVESTTVTVFKYEWPTFNVDAVYMPLQKEGSP